MPSISEPCAFRVLEIPVTEDPAEIDRAYEAAKKKFKHLENNTLESERNKYKRVLQAGVLLKTEKGRKEVVAFHAMHFDEFATQFVSGRSEDITPENRVFLLAAGQDINRDHHLCPELAKAILEAVMDRFGMGVSGANKQPKSPAIPPTLVSGIFVTLRDGVPFIKWKRPDNGCDRVRIRARDDGFPTDESDGRLVFDGLADEFADHAATPGASSHYAIFSFSGEACSSPASATMAFFFADGIRNLKKKEMPGRIEISWDPLPSSAEDLLIFRAPIGTLGVDESGPVPVARGGTHFRRAGKSTMIVDETGAGGLVPGGAYDYRFIVDYGEVRSKRERSVENNFSCTALNYALPVTSVVLHSVPRGLSISWKRPAERLDDVIVVRSEARYPEHENDGVAIADVGDSGCLDGKPSSGTKYYYSIFSIYQGHASACARASKLYAQPVTNLRAREPELNPGSIGLQWTLPTGVTAVRLFRRKGSYPKTIENLGALKVEPGEEVELPSTHEATFLDPVEVGPEWFYHLYCRYSDGQWSPPAAVSAKALEPAMKTAAPQYSLSSAGDVNLTWTSPDPAKAKSYRYRIWRRTQSAAEPVGESSGTNFCDLAGGRGGPVPGRCYEYAIESMLGRVEAGPGAWTRVPVTRDVIITQELGVNGCAHLEWSVVPNIWRVEVVRESDRREIPNKLSSAEDCGLTNGKTYSYKITALFRDDVGDEFRSEGVRVSVTPIAPAEPLEDLKVAWDNGAVRIKWKLPESPLDGILVSRISEPLGISKGELAEVSRIAPLCRLAPTVKEFVDLAAAREQINRYALYAVREATATYCGPVTASLVPPVMSLKARNRGDKMWLHWDWPSGVEMVSIRRTAQPPEKQDRNWVVTRGQYAAAGSYQVDSICANPALYRYELRSLSFADGEKIVSLIPVSVEEMGGSLPKVTYKVNVKKSVVEVVCDVREALSAGSRIGGLALARSSAHDPQSLEGASVVERWFPSLEQTPKVVVLKDANPPTNAPAYYRVFSCASDSNSQFFSLVDPPLSERKVDLR